MINCNNALISTNNIDPIYVLLLWAALHSGDEISHSRVFITQLRNPNLERVVVKYVLEKGGNMLYHIFFLPNCIAPSTISALP